MSTGGGFSPSLKAPDRGLKRLDFSNIFPANCDVNPVKSFLFAGKIIINPDESKHTTGKIENGTVKITILPN